MLQCKNEFGHIKLRSCLCKAPFTLQVPKQLATRLVVRDKKQFRLRLEAELEADKEGTVLTLF